MFSESKITDFLFQNFINKSEKLNRNQKLKNGVTCKNISKPRFNLRIPKMKRKALIKYTCFEALFWRPRKTNWTDIPLYPKKNQFDVFWINMFMLDELSLVSCLRLQILHFDFFLKMLLLTSCCDSLQYKKNNIHLQANKIIV